MFGRKKKSKTPTLDALYKGGINVTPAQVTPKFTPPPPAPPVGSYPKNILGYELVQELYIVRATLDWCNEIRAGRGLPPLDKLPRGVRRSPASCPCGAATGIPVYATHYLKTVAGGQQITEQLPPAVRQFVQAFDAGELPQLVEGFTNFHVPDPQGAGMKLAPPNLQQYAQQYPSAPPPFH